MIRTKIIVADSGPLIALATMDLIQYLPDLFNDVFITDEVKEECIADLSRPMASIIYEAIENDIIKLKRSSHHLFYVEAARFLDRGEASVISLARELKCAVLIDEKKGRRIAKSEGIDCKGSFYCLINCKRLGLISSAAEKLTALKVHGYSMSDKLVTAVLARCGESG